MTDNSNNDYREAVTRSGKIAIQACATLIIFVTIFSLVFVLPAAGVTTALYYFEVAALGAMMLFWQMEVVVTLWILLKAKVNVFTALIGGVLSTLLALLVETWVNNGTATPADRAGLLFLVVVFTGVYMAVFDFVPATKKLSNLIYLWQLKFWTIMQWP